MSKISSILGNFSASLVEAVEKLRKACVLDWKYSKINCAWNLLRKLKNLGYWNSSPTAPKWWSCSSQSWTKNTSKSAAIQEESNKPHGDFKWLFVVRKGEQVMIV